MIYFIQAQTSKAIKIGTADDPRRRLVSLQVGNAEELVLIGTVPGDRDREAVLHRELSAWHLRGEWFQGSAEVLARIVGLLPSYEYPAGSAVAMLDHPRFEGAFDRGSTTSVDELQALVRRATRGAVVGTVAWGEEPSMSGETGRCHSFQVMPDDDLHPYWDWQLDNCVIWHPTPCHAVAAWLNDYRIWVREAETVAL